MKNSESQTRTSSGAQAGCRRGRFLLLAGIAATALTSAQANTLYVDLNSTNPIPPFSGWITAATNIQDAVDASGDGDLVLVTNGVYATGGRRWFDSGTNRVTLTNSVTLRSANGPSVTWIVGNRITSVGSALTNAARCVYMGNNAVLSGFTLSNGEGGAGNYPAGGGIFGGTATNCVLTGNLATNAAGGGAYRATLVDCQLIGNSASSGGGACACTLIRCTVVSNNAANGGGVFGGGVYGVSIITNCVLTRNSASSSGGGANGGTLSACSISNNTAPSGGGVSGSTLNNCLVVGNSAASGGGGYVSILNNCLVISNSAGTGGGVYSGTISNCTVVLNVATNNGGGIAGGSGAYCYNSVLYYNSAPAGSNNIGTKFNNCCTQPNFSDGGITNEPLLVNFVGGDFHLQSNSPCINSGDNRFVNGSADLDGQPRIAGGTVDIGCYEYQTPASAISYAWLQQYGLPIDGSADFADLDSDGMNNWREWIADTSPTNALSLLAIKQIVPSGSGTGITVKWQSVLTRTYYLQRSSNLAQPGSFASVRSNIFGSSGTTTFVDQSATNAGPYFYRVGIQ